MATATKNQDIMRIRLSDGTTREYPTAHFIVEGALKESVSTNSAGYYSPGDFLTVQLGPEVNSKDEITLLKIISMELLRGETAEAGL